MDSNGATSERQNRLLRHRRRRTDQRHHGHRHRGSSVAKLPSAFILSSSMHARLNGASEGSRQASIAPLIEMSDLSARNPVHDMYEEKEFETLQYDVTDTGVQTILIMTCPLLCMPLVPGVIGTKRLVLENEEAVLETKCTLCDTHRRRPYGEMGFVDSIRCLCCTGFMSGIYNYGPLAPGCGCSDDVVEEVVHHMRERVRHRGDTGNILRIEESLRSIRSLQTSITAQSDQLHAIAEHLNVEVITVPPK